MRYPNGCHAAGANNFKIILSANGCSVVPQPRLLPIHVMAGDQGGRCLRALQDDAAQWLWLRTPDRPVQDSACARLTSDPREADTTTLAAWLAVTELVSS